MTEIQSTDPPGNDGLVVPVAQAGPVILKPGERTLREELRYRIGAQIDGHDALLATLRQVVETNDWENYNQSAEDYLSDATRGRKLPAGMRRDMSRALSDYGLTQREIGGALGVSVGTVNTDLKGPAVKAIETAPVFSSEQTVAGTTDSSTVDAASDLLGRFFAACGDSGLAATLLGSYGWTKK